MIDVDRLTVHRPTSARDRLDYWRIMWPISYEYKKFLKRFANNANVVVLPPP